MRINNNTFKKNEELAKQLDKKIKINNKTIDKREILLRMIKKCQKIGIEIPKNIKSLSKEELEKVLENIDIEKK